MFINGNVPSVQSVVSSQFHPLPSDRVMGVLRPWQAPGLGLGAEESPLKGDG